MQGLRLGAPVQIIQHVCKCGSSGATGVAAVSLHLLSPCVKCVCLYLLLCVLTEQPCFTSRHGCFLLSCGSSFCFLVWLLASVSALLFLLQHVELDWKLLEPPKLVFIVFSLSGMQGYCVFCLFF